MPPRPARPETLDIEQPDALLAYLRAEGHIPAGELPLVRNLAGGVSNRTVLLERPNGEAWVLKQALAKLRVPVDWFSDPARIGREAAGMRWLGRLVPAGSVPALLFEDAARHLLAMEAVPQPHENFKTLLLAGRVEAGHIRQFARLLGTIHRGAYERREEVAGAFEDRAFFESLRLEPYYEYAATQVPAAAGFLTELVARTRALRYTLVHGDYSPKNILVHEGRLVLLDHEVIHYGDGAFDLGFALTHLLSKAHHVRACRSDLAGGAMLFWEVYRQEVAGMPWETDLEPRAVRHALGCLLARVAGRSPLEYLDEEERSRQRDAAVALMETPPATVAELIEKFLERV